MIVALFYLVDTSGWLALCFPITLTTTQTTSIYINLLRQVDSPELSEVDLDEGRLIDHFNYQCHYAIQTNWIQLTDLLIFYIKNSHPPGFSPPGPCPPYSGISW